MASQMVSALVDFRAASEADAPLRLAFGAPFETLVARAPMEVQPLLDQVEAHARAGRWAVGFVRYEAAVAFDAALSTHDADGPLAHFDIHEVPIGEADPSAVEAWQASGATAAVDWRAGLSRTDFDAQIAEILRAIADGELYQVNLTTRLRGRMQGDPFALFAALRRAQPEAYSACLRMGDETVLSVSPELFFDWRADDAAAPRLLARPMKGTAPRGATTDEDVGNARHLVTSEKERAENLMIVDLLRNDLSRLARPFSVRVPRLFHTQAWPTVWQMSSDVEALTREGTRLRDVFAALFPCGSVTGAPKVQAMRAIRRLEPDARGIYCGAVGVVRPGGHATFNVPIRTVVLRGEEATCGLGSGITADATADGEWREWGHKRAFVDRASQAFELLETLRLQDGVAVNGDEHLARLREAAVHFGFVAPEAAARDALQGLARAHPAGAWRVRLLAEAGGRVRAEAFAFVGAGVPAAAPAAAASAGLPPPARPRVRLADRPIAEAHTEFVRFKTTRRAHYDTFAPTTPDLFDTLLWNDRGELTEFTRGNVALCLGGRWLTPARACGLLPGIGRAHALRQGRITEAVLHRDMLVQATGLAFINSLRGWIDVELS